MGVDSVAPPITQTAAVLTPAINTGAASGNSMRNNRCRFVIPTPRAASMTAGSRFVSPVTPLRRIGNIEYNVRASRDGKKPAPKNPHQTGFAMLLRSPAAADKTAPTARDWARSARRWRSRAPATGYARYDSPLPRAAG